MTEFDDLMAALLRKLGLADPQEGPSGALSIEVDGRIVRIEHQPEHGAALVLSEIAGAGETDAASSERLLEVNYSAGIIGIGTIGREPRTGRLVLIERVPLAGLDADGFATALEAVLNRADDWRTLVVRHRPLPESLPQDVGMIRV